MRTYYSRKALVGFTENIETILPINHKTFVYNFYNVGPTSMTLGRRCANVVQMVCVYWDTVFMHITTNIAHVLTVGRGP